MTKYVQLTLINQFSISISSITKGKALPKTEVILSFNFINT